MKNAKKECDKLWAELVKKRADYKCEYCGKTNYLNAHHIYSRSNNSTRHDPENGIALCSGHHTLSSQFSAHKTPADFMDWIVALRGYSWLKTLRQRSKMPLIKPDYAGMALWLRNEINKL